MYIYRINFHNFHQNMSLGQDTMHALKKLYNALFAAIIIDTFFSFIF